MKIIVNYADGVVNLPRSAVKSIRYATREDMAVLIAALSEPAAAVDLDSCADAVADAAGVGRGQLMASLAFWRGAGVIGIEGAEAEVAAAEKPGGGGEVKSADKPKKAMKTALPELSAADIERIVSESPERRSLLHECQQTMGHMFNNTESAIVIGMRENLGLDDEYILLLMSFCVRRGKASVRYVEKMANTLYERDIDTTEALEDHLAWLEASEGLEGRLRTLFGWGTRSFSKKERDFLERWGRGFGYGYDMIEAAYNATVDAIGKVSMPYMNKILESWHTKGYATPEEVSAGEGNRQKAVQDGSFDTDEFFRMAVMRGVSGGDKGGNK